ncbi:uncharacterized protein EV422DRAFT_541347 [Fimicolochytrium jonesii]|uniref:uncharacterized protein n=1 Tax=Fimicolochytrium jonesii TaxID=1396493 RepID=UPI0022FEF6C8|nr:uncharacterized protein EV422DRAFT_541347 [Fimicolochytrium jonesii]KAI8817597.1 hypothetical protein EV422DRAFT_541347 [Fimicolochytrium jonesii]
MTDFRASREDRKRPVIAEEGEAASEHPYPSKRLNNSSNFLDQALRVDPASIEADNRGRRRSGDVAAKLESEAEEDPDGGIAGSNVLNYQKLAIWRQMQHYKRESAAASEKIEKLEERQHFYESSLAVANHYVHKVFEDVQAFLQRLEDHEIGSVNGLKAGSRVEAEGESAPSALLEVIAEPRFPEEDVDLFLKEKWSATNEVLAALLKRVDATASHGSVTRPLSEKADLDGLQAKLHTLSAQNRTLESELHKRERLVKDLKMDLSEASNRAMKLERKLDRISTSSNGAKEHVDSVDDKPRPADPDDESMAAISELRSVEIAKLSAEKRKLMEELDQTHLKYSNRSLHDDQIRESHIYRNLEEEYKYHLSENEVLKQRLERMTGEIEEYRAERTKFAEELEAEHITRRKVLETEMRRLESDLTRVRGNRDQLQHNLDLRCAKDNVEIAQLQEIRVLANARKDRITCLEADILRLKLHLAANLGDKALLLFFEENPEGNPLADLRQRLKDAQSRIRSLENETQSRDRYSDTRNSDSDRRSYRHDLESLQSNLDKYRRWFGDANPDSDPTKKLVGRVEQLEKDLEQKTLALETLKKTEARLAEEFDQLGAAWTELEEQCTRKVLNSSEKEDHILRLVAERTKFDQKCAMMSKDQLTSGNLIIALRKQAEKQLDHINVLEQREKNLSQQLHTLEREVVAHKSFFEQQTRKEADFMRQLAQYKDVERQWTAKYENVSTLLKKRIAAQETEAQARRQAEERVMVLQKKMEKQRKVEPTTPADSSTSKELEQLRMLLRCSSCVTNLKSHVLLKCMHTFCKDCIDHQVTSRQRKCPTCGLTFAHQDVRQVYL